MIFNPFLATVAATKFSNMCSTGSIERVLSLWPLSVTSKMDETLFLKQISFLASTFSKEKSRCFDRKVILAKIIDLLKRGSPTAKGLETAQALINEALFSK